MPQEENRCQAITQAGTQCKNRAQEGSPYCYVHRNWTPAKAPASSAAEPSPPQTMEAQGAPAGEPTAAASPASATLTDADREEFRQLAAELNALAEQLRASEKYIPPSFTVHGLISLLQENIYRFTPQAQREIIETLRSNLQGTKPEDLLNPDTWKGFWYVLNYLAQNQKTELADRINRRLEQIPGFALLSDLRNNLKEAKPSDFLEPDTWKGLYYIVNYSARTQIEEWKRRILGEEDEE